MGRETEGTAAAVSQCRQQQQGSSRQGAEGRCGACDESVRNGGTGVTWHRHVGKYKCSTHGTRVESVMPGATRGAQLWGVCGPYHPRPPMGIGSAGRSAQPSVGVPAAAPSRGLAWSPPGAECIAYGDRPHFAVPINVFWESW